MLSKKSSWLIKDEFLLKAFIPDSTQQAFTYSQLKSSIDLASSINLTSKKIKLFDIKLLNKNLPFLLTFIFLERIYNI